MSDEQLELGNALESEGEGFTSEPTKRKLFSDRIVKLLFFLVFGVIAIFLSITIVSLHIGSWIGGIERVNSRFYPKSIIQLYQNMLSGHFSLMMAMI